MTTSPLAESIFLVVATSGRAIAQGLKALDYPVAVIDGFADQDCLAAARVCIKVNRTSFSLEPTEVLNAVQKIQSEYSIMGLFYDAAIESNPELINKIEADFVYGNSISSLQQCKDAKQFFSVLEQYSIPYPEVRYDDGIEKQSNWLLKNQHASGGIGVSMVHEKKLDLEFSYLQKKIKGISFSITFIANGVAIKVLGANTQWSESLGATIPYAYAGAINQVKLNDNIISVAEQYAELISSAYSLIGLNSIDCIYDGEVVHVLEVNPRIPASYDLYETKYGDVMNAHIEACKHKQLPKERIESHLRAHAIVYAPKDIQIPNDMQWPLWTADRPCSGERIPQFEPVCNVYSGGKNHAQVCEMIASRKKTILSKVTAQN